MRCHFYDFMTQGNSLLCWFDNASGLIKVASRNWGSTSQWSVKIQVLQPYGYKELNSVNCDISLEMNSSSVGPTDETAALANTWLQLCETQWSCAWIPDCRNYEIIDLCCFRPLSEVILLYKLQIVFTDIYYCQTPDCWFHIYSSTILTVILERRPLIPSL